MKRIIWTLAISLWSSMISSASLSRPLEISAIVDQSIITNYELYQRETELKQVQQYKSTEETLSIMIQEKIESMLATMYQIEVTPIDLERALHHIAQQNNLPNQTALKEKIESEGLSFNAITRSVARQIISSQIKERVVIPQIYVSSADIRNYIQQESKQEHLLYLVRKIIFPFSSEQEREKAQLASQRVYEILQKDPKAFDSNMPALKDFHVDTEEIWIDDRQAKQFLPAFDNKKHIYPTILQGSNFILCEVLTQKPLPNPFQRVTQKKVTIFSLNSSPLRTEEETEKMIHTIYQKIQKGEYGFIQAVSEHLEDNSLWVDGNMGWISIADQFLGTTLLEMIDQTLVGTYSQPFKSSFGWSIIYVTDEKQALLSKEKQEEIARMILLKQREDRAYIDFLHKLENDIYINTDIYKK